MPELKGVLFIDANKFLDLYRLDHGQKLILPLKEWSKYIFITQQVVDEVSRNKIKIVSSYLNEKRKILKRSSLRIPKELPDKGTGKNKVIIDQMKKANIDINILNSSIDDYCKCIMDQVSNSEDEISKTLSQIFSKAVIAKSKVIKRARKRKEIGNPPGKKGDPLGDEISWEQLLNHIDSNTKLWLITRDGDFGQEFGGDIYLNNFLKTELENIVGKNNVYFFKDMLKGLTHFEKIMKKSAKDVISQRDREEIENEEKALPQINSSNIWDIPGMINMADINAEILNLNGRSELARLAGKANYSSELERIAEMVIPTSYTSELARLAEMTNPTNYTSELARIAAMANPISELNKLMRSLNQNYKSNDGEGPDEPEPVE